MLRATVRVLLTGYLGTASVVLAQPPVVSQPPEDPRITDLRNGAPERKLQVLRELRNAQPDVVQAVIADVYRCIHEDADRRVRLLAYQTLDAIHNNTTTRIAGDVKAIFEKPPTDDSGEHALAADVVLNSPNSFPNYIDKLLDCPIYVPKGASRKEILVGYIHQLHNLGYTLGHPESKARELALAAILARKQTTNEAFDRYLKRDLNAGPSERVLALRALAASALPEGEPLARMLKGLDDPEHDVRAAAIDGLTYWGNSTTPYLLQEARDKASPLRGSAHHALVSNRPPSPEIVAVLTDAVANENDDLALTATSALGTLKEKAAPAVPALVARLALCQDPDPADYYTLHRFIVSALGAIGPAAKEADGELRRLLERTDIKHHPDIAQALANIHADAEIAVPILVSVPRTASLIFFCSRPR